MLIYIFKFLINHNSKTEAFKTVINKLSYQPGPASTNWIETPTHQDFFMPNIIVTSVLKPSTLMPDFESSKNENCFGYTVKDNE